MTNKASPAGPPSAVLAARLKVLRGRRGLNVQQLAQKCADLGAHELTATMIYNIESGRPDAHGKRRRLVTVEELFILATALEVAPVHLLVPLDDESPYEITPGRRVPALLAREFIRGIAPLDGMDLRAYFGTMPADEHLEVSHGPRVRTAYFTWGGDKRGFTVSMRSGGDDEQS